MNNENTAFPDLQSLLEGRTSSIEAPSLIDTDAIVQSLMPMMIIFSTVSIMLVLLYLVSIIQRIRVDRATIESRNILREMNERDKVRSGSSSATERSSDSEKKA